MATDAAETKQTAAEKEPNDLHKRAMIRFKELDDFWAENINRALEDIRFRAGDEWPEDIKRKRTDAQRPCLSFRRGEQYIRQVVNDGRQNRPGVKYRPVDSGADPEVAEAFQGITRHILARSSADDAFDTALDHSCGNGFGFFRVLTDYAEPGSFEQEIWVKRIPNPLSVRLSPHQAADGSDAEDGFILEELSREAFTRTYPNAKRVNWKQDATTYAEGWLTELNVRIAEYFYKEAAESTMYLLEDGESIKQDEYENLKEKGVEDLPAIVKTRKVRDVKVKWAKLSGAEILEEGEFPSCYIPILPVYGTERNVNGKVVYEGLIRAGKDPLMLYNFERTAYAERVALTPKAPFVGASGQFEDHDEWETANTENHPYLTYNPIDVNGTPLPPPRRESAADIPAGYAQALQMTAADIQAAFGMYNASIGAPSNEKSGRAIMARQREGDVSTFHYHDNLNRAVRHLGRILLEMIPKVYDTKRVVRLLKEDGSDELAMLNPQLPSGHAKVDGLKVFNLNAGRFDVESDSGPSYTTRRQESADAMLEMARANPSTWQTHGDLIVKAQDWPGADEFAERTKAVMPPPLKAAIAQSENDEEGPSEEVRSIMEQAQQAIQEREQALQAAAAKIQELQAMCDSKMNDAEAKDRELDIKAYQAKTERLKVESVSMTPQQIQALIVDTLAQLSQPIEFPDSPEDTSGAMPIGGMPPDMPPMMPDPNQQPAPPMAPMQ